MKLGKELIFSVTAAIFLLIGTASAIYVEQNFISKDTIEINGQDLSFDEIVILAGSRTIKIDEEEKTGAPLEKLIQKLNLNCPSCSLYTIKGADGYQQTVEWEIMKTGIITDEPRVYFPETAHKFWVSQIVEIEVK